MNKFEKVGPFLVVDQESGISLRLSNDYGPDIPAENVEKKYGTIGFIYTDGKLSIDIPCYFFRVWYEYPKNGRTFTGQFLPIYCVAKDTIVLGYKNEFARVFRNVPNGEDIDVFIDNLIAALKAFNSNLEKEAKEYYAKDSKFQVIIFTILENELLIDKYHQNEEINMALFILRAFDQGDISNDDVSSHVERIS